MVRPRSLADRFWQHVLYRDNPSTCWIWTGAIDPKNGYGQFARQSNPARFVSVFRMAYELTHGRAVPRTRIVRLLCHNKLCCNPAHMQISTQLDRFLTLLDQSQGPYGCWLWQGHTRHGYGTLHLTVNKRRTITGAHRIAFVLAGGTIPPGQFVLHRCDVRACCNPLHLFLGTHAENSADKVAKGRHKIFQGTQHGMAKLTDDAVQEIRRLTGQERPRSVARRFGISSSNVWRIQTGKSWKHLL